MVLSPSLGGFVVLAGIVWISRTGSEQKKGTRHVTKLERWHDDSILGLAARTRLDVHKDRVVVRDGVGRGVWRGK